MRRLHEAHCVEAAAGEGGGVGDGGEVGGFGVYAFLGAAQEPLHCWAHEVAADDGLFGERLEGGGCGQGRADEGLVGPGCAHGHELEGGVGREHVADLRLSEVVDARDHPELVVAVEKIHACGEAWFGEGVPCH